MGGRGEKNRGEGERKGRGSRRGIRRCWVCMRKEALPLNGYLLRDSLKSPGRRLLSKVAKNGCPHGKFARFALRSTNVFFHQQPISELCSPVRKAQVTIVEEALVVYKIPGYQQQKVSPFCMPVIPGDSKQYLFER